MRTIERDIASAVIVSTDRKILMGQKDPQSGGVYADGTWLIPGGGVEAGETVLEALRREIMEEVSIDITPYALTLLDDTAGSTALKTLKSGEQIIVQMKFFTYRVDLDQPAEAVPIQPSEELPTLEWIPIDALGEYNLTPPSVALFAKLGLLTRRHPGP